MPIELYPVFAFRRKAYHHHPWWGDVAGRHPKVTADLRHRIRHEGPLRSLDMEGRGSRGWWDLEVAKRVATALWSAGELAIRERRNFQRTYDLTERVVPARWRHRDVPEPEALERLVVRALEGHGWASIGTLAQTWRVAARSAGVDAALTRLVERREVVPCALVRADGRRSAGWIRPVDLELAARLRGVRPRPDRGVLLSPFDPVLWDRGRVRRLFDFDQILEIFKPEPRRLYGYYCLPVLAGDRLVARLDLKADRQSGTLRVLSRRFERVSGRRAPLVDQEAARTAIDRYARTVALKPEG